MSESTFRVIITLFLGVIVYLLVRNQIKLFELTLFQAAPPSDGLPNGDRPCEQIGFKYQECISSED